MWLLFAVLSAVFAALTSILAKVGIEGVNSNLATAIRTLVVVGDVLGDGIFNQCPDGNQSDREKELVVSNPVGTGNGSFLAVLL